MNTKTGKAKKVLIVEDNELLSTMFKIALEKKGFQTETSLEGKSSIEKVKEFKPDLILLDIMMPGGLSGFDVLDKLRKELRIDTPVIVNSNLTQQKDIDRAFELGANEYLKKSDYTPGEVTKKIEALCA